MRALHSTETSVTERRFHEHLCEKVMSHRRLCRAELLCVTRLLRIFEDHCRVHKSPILDIFFIPCSGVPMGGLKHPPPEIPKAIQNRAKLNPIVKTVKNC